MTPSSHERNKQHAFDSFCKKVLKCEACNGYREISRRKKHSIPFSELPEDAMEQLAAYDRYPWEYNTFILGGDVILIENDLLADALNALPQDNRDILLMYWFLEMADREIAERMNLARRTINNRRLKSYRLLKELMGGDMKGFPVTIILKAKATASAIKRSCLPKSQRKKATQIWFISWMTAFPA